MNTVAPSFTWNSRAGFTAETKTAVFTAWWDDYATEILRLCYCYFGNRADAEDALQEIFLKAWHTMDRFEARNHSQTKSWLLKITIHTCRDALRKPWHRKNNHSIDRNELASMKAASREDRALLLNIFMLPGKYKEVILLHYYQNMPVREIAKMLHNSKRVISRRITKACKLLKQAEEGESK